MAMPPFFDRSVLEHLSPDPAAVGRRVRWVADVAVGLALLNAQRAGRLWREVEGPGAGRPRRVGTAPLADLLAETADRLGPVLTPLFAEVAALSERVAAEAPVTAERLLAGFRSGLERVPTTTPGPDRPKEAGAEPDKGRTRPA
jgi:hypothetical protein